MKTIPKSFPKFEVLVSEFDPEEVSIFNHYTHTFAMQKLRSMKYIAKVFKAYLNNKETLTFSHFPTSEIEKLKYMLPNHKLCKTFKPHKQKTKVNP